MARSLKSIQQLTPIEMKSMSTKQLKSIEKRLFDIKKTREKAFKKNELLKGKFSKTISEKKRGKTKAEIIRNISTISNWAIRPTSTARGHVKMLKQKRAILEESLGFRFKNWDEFNQFGEFMGEMQEKLGKRWEYESIGAVKLFENARRLNIDIKILMKNYDYWTDEKNMRKLEKADKRDFKNLKASTSNYTKALKLESIKKWKNKN